MLTCDQRGRTTELVVEFVGEGMYGLGGSELLWSSGVCVCMSERDNRERDNVYMYKVRERENRDIYNTERNNRE